MAAPIRLLLVDDNHAEARLIREYLADAESAFQIVHVDRLAGAMARMGEGGIDAVLLDMSLPDSPDPDTVARFRSHAGDVPIVVLTGHDDRAVGMRAVQDGAQDFLVKGRVDGPAIERAILQAMSRPAP